MRITAVISCLIITSLLFISGCGDSEEVPIDSVTAEESTNKSQTNESVKFNDVVVKGFYIGMNANEALRLFQSYFPDDETVSSVSDYKSLSPTNKFKFKGGDLSFDENGIVNGFIFSDDGINILFDAKNMSVEEFGKAFVNAYDIPELKNASGSAMYNMLEANMPLVENLGVWEHTTSEGTKIVYIGGLAMGIMTIKTLIFQKTKSEREKLRAFN